MINSHSRVKYLFLGANTQETYRKIIRGKYTIANNEDVEIKKLLSRMFVLDESKRCFVDELLQSPIFNDFR